MGKGPIDFFVGPLAVSFWWQGGLFSRCITVSFRVSGRIFHDKADHFGLPKHGEG